MSKRSPLSPRSSLAGVIELRGILGSAVNNLGIRIVGGEWDVGDTISKEADLVEELGVSRSVIRETFRVLGAKGLIRSRTSDGTRVQPRSEWRLLDPDVLNWRIRSGDTKSLLSDLLTLRLVLEPGIAYNATLMATDKDRERFKAAWAAKQRVFLDQNADPAERRAGFILTDLEFHRALFGAVHSELLEQLFSIIEAALELLIDLQMRAKGYTEKMIGMDESQHLHQAVYEAFMAGDAEAAHQTMRVLIGRAISDARAGFDLLNE
ncbi:MAG: FadR family transcriptional regulator [Alphaproteobacteria bacterium]|nr:FadR family transcriptional regulator [Alphaproteobacteria bacterium]